jgi:transposase
VFLIVDLREINYNYKWRNLRNMKPMTEDEKQAIIELRKQGLSSREIAKRVGRGKTTVTNFLTQQGLITSDKLTEEQKQKILELKAQGLNGVEIGKQIGRDFRTVSAFLTRNGISSVPKIENKLTKKELDELCADYESGLPARAIKEKFSTKNISEKAILKYVESRGIKVRATGKFANITNEDFFETIDTEEKAYILGLLITDGYVIYPKHDAPHNPSWGITLKSEDKYILEKIREIVGSKAKIVDRERNRTGRKTPVTYESQLIVCSAKMVSDLEKYTITQRKTYTVELPQIRQDLMPHLIRGVFDGDGCISSNSITFIGNIQIINAVQKYLINAININHTKIFGRHSRFENSKNISCYSFSFSSKKDVTNFYHLIYDNATIYLSRKKDKFVID